MARHDMKGCVNTSSDFIHLPISDINGDGGVCLEVTSGVPPTDLVCQDWWQLCRSELGRHASGGPCGSLPLWTVCVPPSAQQSVLSYPPEQPPLALHTPGSNLQSAKTSKVIGKSTADLSAYLPICLMWLEGCDVFFRFSHWEKYLRSVCTSTGDLSAYQTECLVSVPSVSYTSSTLYCI
jgi:hypothetical protein